MSARAHPLQLILFIELVEVQTTRDELFDLHDGGWESRRVRPPGRGWRVGRDYERRTQWMRRRPITHPRRRPT